MSLSLYNNMKDPDREWLSSKDPSKKENKMTILRYDDPRDRPDLWPNLLLLDDRESHLPTPPLFPSRRPPPRPAPRYANGTDDRGDTAVTADLSWELARERSFMEEVRLGSGRSTETDTDDDDDTDAHGRRISPPTAGAIPHYPPTETGARPRTPLNPGLLSYFNGPLNAGTTSPASVASMTSQRPHTEADNIQRGLTQPATTTSMALPIRPNVEADRDLQPPNRSPRPVSQSSPMVADNQDQGNDPAPLFSSSRIDILGTSGARSPSVTRLPDDHASKTTAPSVTVTAALTHTPNERPPEMNNHARDSQNSAPADTTAPTICNRSDKLLRTILLRSPVSDMQVPRPSDLDDERVHRVGRMLATFMKRKSNLSRDALRRRMGTPTFTLTGRELRVDGDGVLEEHLKTRLNTIMTEACIAADMEVSAYSYQICLKLKTEIEQALHEWEPTDDQITAIANIFWARHGPLKAAKAPPMEAPLDHYIFRDISANPMKPRLAPNPEMSQRWTTRGRKPQPTTTEPKKKKKRKETPRDPSPRTEAPAPPPMTPSVPSVTITEAVLQPTALQVTMIPPKNSTGPGTNAPPPAATENSKKRKKKPRTQQAMELNPRRPDPRPTHEREYQRDWQPRPKTTGRWQNQREEIPERHPSRPQQQHGYQRRQDRLQDQNHFRRRPARTETNVSDNSEAYWTRMAKIMSDLAPKPTPPPPVAATPALPHPLPPFQPLPLPLPHYQPQPVHQILPQATGMLGQPLLPHAFGFRY